MKLLSRKVTGKSSSNSALLAMWSSTSSVQFFSDFAGNFLNLLLFNSINSKEGRKASKMEGRSVNKLFFKFKAFIFLQARPKFNGSVDILFLSRSILTRFLQFTKKFYPIYAISLWLNTITAIDSGHLKFSFSNLFPFSYS